MHLYVILDETELGLMALVIFGVELLVVQAAMIAFAIVLFLLTFLPVLLSILASH